MVVKDTREYIELPQSSAGWLGSNDNKAKKPHGCILCRFDADEPMGNCHKFLSAVNESLSKFGDDAFFLMSQEVAGEPFRRKGILVAHKVLSQSYITHTLHQEFREHQGLLKYDLELVSGIQ